MKNLTTRCSSLPASRLARIAAAGALLLPAAALRAQTNPVSPFGITPLVAAPIYGAPQNTGANPGITWRAFSGITSFRHPANGHDYAVGCASDGILIVDATANSGDGGPAVTSAVDGRWWWIPETGWLPCSTADQRTAGKYAVTPSNPLGNLMTTDTRNREAVAFVDNGTVYLYSTNHFRSGIWVIELPPPAAWPPSQSILEPAHTAWVLTPTAIGHTGSYPGVVGAIDVPAGTTVTHQYGGGHTISIDAAHRQIYVCGNHAHVPDWERTPPAGDFHGVMTVYDISTVDPRVLTYRDTLRTTTQQAFGPWTAPAVTHDVQILGRWCVVSVIDAAPGGGLATTVPFACWVLIDIGAGWQGASNARVFASGVPPHSAWFDGRYLWGINELTSLNIVIYDVDLPAAPLRTAAKLETPQAPAGSPAIVHHIRAIGHTGFVAHYQDGVHVMDLRGDGLAGTAPLEQRLIANLDTSPLTFPQTPVAIFENKFQGIWDVATDFDSGVVCATQVGSPLGENGGVLVLRYDIGAVNRYWSASPFPPGAPSHGSAPRIGLPENPPRTGQSLILIDENWALYPDAVAVCSFGLATPLVPTVDPMEFRWNLIPATVLLQMVLVNPGPNEVEHYPAGHCVVPFPPGFPVGLRVFCQIVAQQGATRFGASRGTWFGVGG